MLKGKDRATIAVLAAIAALAAFGIAPGRAQSPDAFDLRLDKIAPTPEEIEASRALSEQRLSSPAIEDLAVAAPDAPLPRESSARTRATGEPDGEAADYSIFSGPFDSQGDGDRRASNTPTDLDNDAAAPIGRTSRAEEAPDAARSLPTSQDGVLRRFELPIGTLDEDLVDTSGERGNLPALGSVLRGSGEDDSFAALGIRAGCFLLFPSLEQSVGTSTNLDSSPGGEAGFFTDTEATARLISDWSRHQLEIEGIAGYRRNFGGEVPEEPRLSLDSALRLDISRDYTATLRGSFDYSREDPVESDFASTAERPNVLSYTASGELARSLGPLNLAIEAGLGRESREEGTLSGEFEDFDPPDDSYTTASVGLRAGYEISPLLKPFVEASLARRTFDEGLAEGIERDSLIQELRLGLAFDREEKLLGEIAVGYARNRPDDEALPVTGSPTVDALLAWSPRRGTQVRLTASTIFDPGSTNDEPSTLYEGRLAITQRLRARTELNAAVAVAHDNGTSALSDETRYAGEAGFTYWLSRELALRGQARHEWFRSAAPGADYETTEFLLGLRMQR